MSLFADICRGIYASEEDISFDAENNTWTVLPTWGLDNPLTGIPSKNMALAICRALYASYRAGSDAASYS